MMSAKRQSMCYGGGKDGTGLRWVFFEEGLELGGALAAGIETGEEVEVGFQGGSIIRCGFLRGTQISLKIIKNVTYVGEAEGHQVQNFPRRSS